MTPQLNSLDPQITHTHKCLSDCFHNDLFSEKAVKIKKLKNNAVTSCGGQSGDVHVSGVKAVDRGGAD